MLNVARMLPAVSHIVPRAKWRPGLYTRYHINIRAKFALNGKITYQMRRP